MEFNLSLVSERTVVRETVKGVLWSIFFHRLFGTIIPGTCEVLGIEYPLAENQNDLDSLMDEKIDDLIKTELEPLEDQPRVGCIVVQFWDKNITKPKKKSGWFGQNKEDAEPLNLWESWIIKVTCLPLNKDLNPRVVNVQSFNRDFDTTHEGEMSIDSFKACLGKIIDIVDSHKSHIPPITTLDSSPFPYTIGSRAILSETAYAKDESWGNYIKKILD